MSDNLNKIMTSVEEFNRKKEELTEIVRLNFKEVLLGFLNKYPDVKAIGWLQYTPYFNDGDACEFSVQEFCYTTSEDYADDTDWFWEGAVRPQRNLRVPDPSNPGAWKYELVEGLSDEDLSQGYTLEMAKEFDVLSTELSKIDDSIYQEMFGDHSKVIVTRDGIEVEEYDHD